MLDVFIKNRDRFAPLRIVTLRGNFVAGGNNMGSHRKNGNNFGIEKFVEERVAILGKMGIIVNL